MTGGVVYRGSDAPELAGRYVYGDFCSGTLWSLQPSPNGSTSATCAAKRAKVPQITHIGDRRRG